MIANEISFVGVLPAYFNFQRLELAAGNLFLPVDVRNQNPVVVLTAKLAEALFGEEDPLGGREIPVDLWEDRVVYTIIGGVLAPSKEGDYDGFLAYEESRSAYAPATLSPYGPTEGGMNENLAKSPSALMPERIWSWPNSGCRAKPSCCGGVKIL